jgi:FtsZ-interacting cell division protein ZipA
MSALGVIAIIIGALIVLAIVVSVARRTKQKREFGQVQAEAQHDDVRHHHERAEEHRTEAAVAEERARRANAEAELDEERAGRREHQLEN